MSKEGNFFVIHLNLTILNYIILFNYLLVVNGYSVGQRVARIGQYRFRLMIFNFCFFGRILFFGWRGIDGTGVCNQGLRVARQALYHFNHSTSCGNRILWLRGLGVLFGSTGV